MSAREVIRLIEALPESERVEVTEYVKQADKTATTGVRYANIEDVKQVAVHVFETNDALFRKLAQ